MEKIEDEEVNWLDCVSAIETNKGIVYFCDSEYFAQGRWNTSPEQQGETIENYEDSLAESLAEQTLDDGGHSPVPEQCRPSASSDIESRNGSVLKEEHKQLLTPVADFVSRFEHGRFMYSITAYNPLDTAQDTLQNFFGNHLLLADLRAAFPDGNILNNFSYFPHRPHHFERGFTVIVPLNYPRDHEGLIHNLAVKYKQAAYFKCRILPDGQSVQTIVLLEKYVKEVQESLVVVERLSYHPAYLHRKNNSVFHNLYDALDILLKCDSLAEVNQVVDIAKQQLALLSACGQGQMGRRQKHPVLVIEGTCDAGVSAQSLLLSQALGGTLLQSPPSCLQHLRATFDSQNELIRGAFYTVGNYILAAEVTEASKEAPVILDRFWGSTAAFTISSEVGSGVANLPPRDHFVYQWPRDLLEPDAVILLGSKKSIRNGTVSSAAISAGREKSKRGGNERVTKQLMFEALRRMSSPSWIEVDPIKDRCHSKEAVTMVTLDKLHQRKVGGFHLEVDQGHSICPGLCLHPKVEHDLLPVDGPRSLPGGASLVGDATRHEIGFL